MLTVKDGVKFGFGLLLVGGAWKMIEYQIDKQLGTKNASEEVETEEDKVITLNNEA